MLKDSNAFRGEWRLCEVAGVSPDERGKVRNVSVMVKSKQGGSTEYVSTKPIYLNRHVSNLVLLIPAEERGTHDQDVNTDAAKKNVA